MKKSNLISIKVGKRIRSLRKNRGITQEKLADLSGVDSKHIQLMESPKPTNARIDTIENIANSLGLGLHDFFFDEAFKSKEINQKKETKGLLTAKSNQKLRERILEDKYAYAIFDPNPVNRGHILIYSKRILGSFFETLPEEKYSIIEMIEKAKIFLEREFKPDGFNIGWNEGQAAGQSGSHLHIHIIPRYRGDMSNPQGGVRGVIPERQKYIE